MQHLPFHHGIRIVVVIKRACITALLLALSATTGAAGQSQTQSDKLPWGEDRPQLRHMRAQR